MKNSNGCSYYVASIFRMFYTLLMKHWLKDLMWYQVLLGDMIRIIVIGYIFETVYVNQSSLWSFIDYLHACFPLPHKRITKNTSIKVLRKELLLVQFYNIITCEWVYWCFIKQRHEWLDFLAFTKNVKLFRVSFV